MFKLISDSSSGGSGFFITGLNMFGAQPAKQGICGLLLWDSGIKVSSAFTLTYCAGHPGHVSSLSV